jgi:excisionase family DNA binding protein
MTGAEAAIIALTSATLLVGVVAFAWTVWTRRRDRPPSASSVSDHPDGADAAAPACDPVTWETTRLLDAVEIAGLLGVKPRWVKEAARAGKVPHVRLGRYRRFRADAVRAWVEEQEQGGLAARRLRAVPASGTK